MSNLPVRGGSNWKHAGKLDALFRRQMHRHFLLPFFPEVTSGRMLFTPVSCCYARLVERWMILQSVTVQRDAWLIDRIGAGPIFF